MESCLASQSQWLWDWPFEAEGDVRCKNTPEKFHVTFAFKFLKAKDMALHNFNKLKRSDFTYSVGLCSTKDKYSPYCRLEIRAFPNSNMISIDAYRELDRCSMYNGKFFQKRLRKCFKVPDAVDLNTLQVKISHKGKVELEAKKVDPKQKRVPIRIRSNSVQ